jgi:hypothetical protein
MYKLTSRLGVCFALAFLLLSMGGCNTPVAVHYTPIAAVQTLADDPQQSPRLFVMRFTDKRPDGDIVGENKNLYGMKINDVRTTDDVSLIVAEAMTDALQKGGVKCDLHPERKAGEPVPASELTKYDYLLTGEITRFFVSTKPGWNTVDATAEVTIRLCLTRNGKEEWIGPINGTAKQGTLASDLTSCMTQAVDSAIGNCMRATIQHLSANGILHKKA